MKYLVTYASKYGSTKKYAQWIAEALSCDLMDAGAVKPGTLAQYDVLIHGGGLYAGGFSGISVITKNYELLSGKPVILFSCGLADPNDPENISHIEAGLAKVLTPEMQKHIKQFHLRGGIDYGRLGLTHKAMMAMLRQSMLKKDRENLRDEDRLMLDTYGQQVDFTDRSTITPLVEYVLQLG